VLLRYGQAEPTARSKPFGQLIQAFSLSELCVICLNVFVLSRLLAVNQEKIFGLIGPAIPRPRPGLQVLEGRHPITNSVEMYRVA